MANITQINPGKPTELHPRPSVIARESSAVAPTQAAAPYRDVLIARMKAKADLSQSSQLPRGPERKLAVYNDLMATASSSQAGAIAKLGALKEQGLVSSYESMFLPNAIVVKAAPGKYAAVSDALAGLADIQGVTENKTWGKPAAAAADAARGAALTGGAHGHLEADPEAANTVEWGVQKINAPKAWARGYTGAGVTVGVVDTGLDTAHPAISSHYRGTQADGKQVDDYNWFDGTGGSNHPYDDGEHGTHVAGSVAGGTADLTTGVAPGAKLIAAKAILGSGSNTTEATLKALQFMLAPTDSKGLNPDPRRGADIINNSWGNADLNDSTFIDTWDGLIAAGIEPVTAAGNDGPFGKVSPPGSYPQGISVAASTSRDTVASFSSRGPSKFDPNKVIPMIAAPGQGINSSVPGGGYSVFSGTSMASPHVAGAVALMLQAKPNATHDELVHALESTAVDIDKPGPDNAAGYGRIDVDKAIDVLLAGTAGH